MFDKESNELLVKLKVATALGLMSIVTGLMALIAILDKHC